MSNDTMIVDTMIQIPYSYGYRLSYECDSRIKNPCFPLYILYPTSIRHLSTLRIFEHTSISIHTWAGSWSKPKNFGFKSFIFHSILIIFRIARVYKDDALTRKRRTSGAKIVNFVTILSMFKNMFI